MGQVRWKIFIQHTISATMPSTYQNLFKLVEIDEVLTETKMHSFLRHGVVKQNALCFCVKMHLCASVYHVQRQSGISVSLCIAISIPRCR